jgi:hypothetical protein
MQPVEPSSAPAVEPAFDPAIDRPAGPWAEPPVEVWQPAPRPSLAVDVLIGFALFVTTYLIYLISMRLEGPTPYTFHVLLSDAMVHGRLDLPELSWLELAKWKGKFYTVFPPGPALLLTPFTYFGSAWVNQQYFSVVMGSLNVVLCYAVLRTLFQSRAVAVWVAVLHAFGTIHWYHAEVGSGWYCGHTVAITFLWLSLLVSFRGKHFFWAGLFLSFAFLSRLTTIVGGIFFPIYFFADFITLAGRHSRIQWRNVFALAAGVAPGVLGYYLYNYLRFGTIEDLGYTIVIHPLDTSYPHGLFSVKYVWIHLGEMLGTMPRVLPDPPYLAPSLFAMAIWIATPALLLMFRAPPTRLTLASVAAAVFIAAPNLMHGGNGYTQFGYRHTLDFLPFLLILIASGMRERVGWIAIALIVASIVVNFWGVLTLSVLKIHGF